MKIYLAGKVGKHDWRHHIVSGLGAALDATEPSGWPILRGAIFNEHDYVGPFFIRCDHGCYHGLNEHCMGADNGGCCGKSYSQAIVPAYCFAAINSCDLFFAWFDADCHTAYGTLIELGWAMAMRKRIGIGVAEGVDASDLWFSMRAAERLGTHNCVVHDCNPNFAHDALLSVLQVQGEISRLNSLLETI